MKLLLLLIYVLILTCHSPAQEQEKVMVGNSLKINNLEKILYQLDEFEFYNYLTAQKRQLKIESESAILWLKAASDISDRNQFNNDITPGYLHSPLYKQYVSDSKLNPLRTALGMLQAGAVGYLAYRHLKKFVLKK